MAGEQQNPHEGVWQQTLRDASSSGGTSFTNKSVLILGDRNCGKTSLVARLQGRDVNEFSKGLAVDYALMEIKDEKADEIASKINIWQLEGEEHHADLLKYAINAENVSESLAIIVLDLSAPWNLHDSLAKWLKVLDAHLRTLKLTRQAQDSLRSTNEKRFQTYKVPAADAPKQLPSLHKHKTTQDTSPSSSDAESSKQEDLPPLPNGVLDHNIGIPILVVGCKADSLETHARENFMKDSDFEYIQRDLRKTCLSYGAGLIYVSSRKDNNCSLLKDYIISVLYDISFYQEPEVYEKDLVFVPIGWDSPSKVELIELSGNYNNDNFSQVIFKPRSLAQREQESSVANDIEDEQSFLSHLRDTLEKMDLAASKADQLSEAAPAHTSSSSSSSFQSEYSSPAPQNPSLSTTPLPTTPLNSGSRISATTPAQTPTKGPVDIQSLNSFFSNLLERTPGKKPTAPSDPSSPASFT